MTKTFNTNKSDFADLYFRFEKCLKEAEDAKTKSIKLFNQGHLKGNKDYRLSKNVFQHRLYWKKGTVMPDYFYEDKILTPRKAMKFMNKMEVEKLTVTEYEYSFKPKEV